VAAYSVPYVLAYMLHNMTEASYVSPRGQMWVIFLALLFLGACRVPPRAAAAGVTMAAPPPTPREAGHASA